MLNLSRLVASSLASQVPGSAGSFLPALSRLVNTSSESLSAAPATKKVAAGTTARDRVPGFPTAVFVYPTFPKLPSPLFSSTGSSGKPPLYKEFQLYRYLSC